MAQGFVKSNNLAESSNGALDRAILNNLGGPNIANDILLFDGNTKFVSKLLGTEYTVSGGVISVTGEGRVAFSNGTLISHDGGPYQYTVRNSNGIDKFELYTTVGNVLFSNPSGTLRRNDTVTGINLANLAIKRLETDNNTTSGISVASSGNINVFDAESINSQVSYINGHIALFYFKRGRVPLTYQTSTFNLPIQFNGAFRIVNTSNINPPTSSSPGLFIVSGNTALRAFSDDSNPWSEVTGALQTSETDAQCSVLKLKPTSSSVNINFDSTGNNHMIAESNTIGSYTHKLPVMVNGQQYFLLLKAPPGTP
jgi:hypothetical protein